MRFDGRLPRGFTEALNCVNGVFFSTYCFPRACLMNFQIKFFDLFAFADSENAMVDGECEALELDRPGFLSQLRLSISCMVEEKK